jgi:hypothetical protein
VWTRRCGRGRLWTWAVVDAGGGARAGQREADIDDEATCQCEADMRGRKEGTYRPRGMLDGGAGCSRGRGGARWGAGCSRGSEVLGGERGIKLARTVTTAVDGGLNGLAVTCADIDDKAGEV